jgi:hypothetical protein
MQHISPQSPSKPAVNPISEPVEEDTIRIDDDGTLHLHKP